MIALFVNAVLLLAAVSAPATGPAPKATDPKVKLSAFAGRWKTEATFADGKKASSDLDCSWSPQRSYLLCEQKVKLPDREQRQLTVYSYSSADKVYRYSTFSDPGAAPSSGRLEINGAIWTYHFSFENGGKTMQIRTTNEFTNPSTEIFKVESSGDGVNWTPMMQGSGHKVTQ